MKQCNDLSGIVFMLLVCMSLQVNHLLAQQQQQEDYQKIGLRLIESSCKAENLTGFYLNIREMENMTRMYPAWPNSESLSPGVQIFWSDQEPLGHIFPTYPAFFDDYLASTPKASSYRWCIYLYDSENAIYGCIRGEEKWGTPLFKQLGLLDKLHINDASADFGLPNPLIFLSIDPIDETVFPLGNALWHNSLISVSIDWQNPDLESVGEYRVIDSQRHIPQYITDISTQDDSFLVEGKSKQFVCEVFGTYRERQIGWWQDGNHLQEQESLCGLKPCENVNFEHHIKYSSNCNDYESRNIRVGTDTMILRFHNASRDETGEYVCLIGPSVAIDAQNVSRSLYIYVVFVEVFAMTLPLNERGQLRCSVKAPTDAIVTVWHNNINLNQLYNARHIVKNCNHFPQISMVSEVLDDQFSLFYITVHICRVSIDNVGSYKCQVEYSIPTDTETKIAAVRTDITVLVNENEALPDPARLSLGGAIGIGFSALVLALLFISIISVALYIMVQQVSQQRMKQRKSRTHLNRLPASFRTTNPFNYKTVPANSDRMEFSRKDLEFHEQLGKGRFGKVLLASAYNIVPYNPTINKVAVKKAISNTVQTDEMMQDELEIMKRLMSDEHICNLLAYCTVDGPMLIIMEYASRGNLKEFLDLCRQTVQQMGQPLSIPNTYQNVFETSASDEGRKPGLISESTIRNYAFQIACGLEHLQNLDVVHCDLAARNILISENFVLKIGDFGMARIVSDNETVLDLDGIVAVKWAALEVLENKGYMLESDIWSYAVVIWEIASYGGRPFSDQKIGVSLEKFIRLLRAGHRLPQPSGLSSSIFQTLLACWSADASARPSCASLKQFFNEKSGCYFNS